MTDEKTQGNKSLDTPRTDAFIYNPNCDNHDTLADFSRQLEVELLAAQSKIGQLERELAVALSRLELWREHAFDTNASEEMVEIDELIGELTEMRRAYEEGNK